MQLKSVAVEESQPQLLNEPLKVTVSEHVTMSTSNTQSVHEKESEVKLSAPKLDVHLVPEKESEVKLSAPELDVHSVPEEEPELNISAPKVDLMLEKLTIFSHRSVIFPDHIQVPENLKTQFTFGSLDASPDDFKPLSVADSPQQNGEIATEPSLSNENDSSTAQEGESKDDPLPHLFEHELPSQDDNVSSDAAVKHEERKLETMPPIGGFQNPVIQTTRDYHYGFMPYMMSPHFVQLDTPELQNVSPLIASAMGPTPTTQPGVPGQSSIALSPPLFPYFRQPYPNYIPYNPYYPHMYFPQNAHFMNRGVFLQQPPTTMVKFPAPSQNKDASNEEVTVSQANDNNIHSAVQEGEDPQVWAHAGGREVPDLAPNYYYHFPHQGQHMAFSPFYHSSQTMTPSQPLEYHHHQSHSAGTIQPEHRVNSQTT